MSQHRLCQHVCICQHADCCACNLKPCCCWQALANIKQPTHPHISQADSEAAAHATCCCACEGHMPARDWPHPLALPDSSPAASCTALLRSSLPKHHMSIDATHSKGAAARCMQQSLSPVTPWGQGLTVLAGPVPQSCLHKWVDIAQMHDARAGTLLQAACSQQEPSQTSSTLRVAEAGLDRWQADGWGLQRCWCGFACCQGLAEGVDLNRIPQWCPCTMTFQYRGAGTDLNEWRLTMLGKSRI